MSLCGSGLIRYGSGRAEAVGAGAYALSGEARGRVAEGGEDVLGGTMSRRATRPLQCGQLMTIDAGLFEPALPPGVLRVVAPLDE